MPLKVFSLGLLLVPLPFELEEGDLERTVAHGLAGRML